MLKMKIKEKLIDIINEIENDEEKGNIELQVKTELEKIVSLLEVGVIYPVSEE